MVIVSKDKSSMIDANNSIVSGLDVRTLVKESDRHLISGDYKYRFTYIDGPIVRGMAFSIVLFLMSEDDVPTEILDSIRPIVVSSGFSHMLFQK